MTKADRSGRSRSSATGPAFIDDYTRDLTARDLQRVFTRETRAMVSFFTQGTQQADVTQKDLLRHPFRNARQFFLAFAMRLTAARRMLYAGAVAAVRDRADSTASRPIPGSPCGTPASSSCSGVRPDPPDPAARGGRSADAEARTERGARHPARHAAGRHPHGRHHRGPRRDAAGQHRRRRFLRHPAARRRPGADHPWRRRRQGHAGGAPHGPLPRHDPDAARRGPATGRAGPAPERAAHAPLAAIALHHRVHRAVRSAHERDALRECRAEPTDGAPRLGAPGVAATDRHGTRALPQGDLRGEHADARRRATC